MSDEYPESYLKLDQQLCFSLYSVSNALTRAYRPLLEKLDLTYPQYLAMLVIWNQSGISIKELGIELHLDTGTLTPLLKRLEGKGLIERRASQSDERSKHIFLTEAGVALREPAESVPLEICDAMGLELDEIVALQASCNKLFQHIQDHSDPEN